MNEEFYKQVCDTRIYNEYGNEITDKVYAFINNQIENNERKNN